LSNSKKFFIAVISIVLCGAIILLIFSILRGSAVSPGNAIVENKPVDNKPAKKIIGVSVMNYVNEYWIDLIDGVRAYSKDAGYEVMPVQVNDNVDEQVRSIDDFIAKGVDGIIVAAINETALEPSIQKAMNSGIKVIAHLHDLKEFNVIYGPKEYEMGFVAGRYMGKLLKDNGIDAPKLAMLNYPDLGTLIDREKGLEDGLREFVPEAVIVAKELGHKPDLGKSAAIKIIKNHSDINGFIGINDNGLMGALEASQESGLSKRKDFFIVGIGGDSIALDAIKKNTAFKATVNTDPWLNGYNETKYMQDMFEGKDYLNKAVYFSPLSIIDLTNVDQVISEKERRRKLLEK
jgi:ABC-type sugar transport system substrate-binding protein